MNSQQKKQLVLYAAGTIGFLSLPVVFAPSRLLGKNVFADPVVKKETMDYVLLCLFFYLNYFVFIPRFFFNQRYVLYGAICICSLIVVTIIPPTLFPLPFWEEKHFTPWEHFAGHLRHNMFSFLAVVLLSMTLRISHRWRQAEKEKLTSQLSYLKGQINPHFLFNTLNSIYYLSLEKSAKAPDAIIRLSNMMRFVISDANDNFVDLAKEISYVTNFIELQKLRLGNTASLSYKISGTTVEKRVAPLILIPFIENAFKHGVNPEELSCILVDIEIGDKELTLNVNNKKVHRHYTHVKSGLGIANAKKRLDYIYPGKHVLTINDEPKDYIVTLKLNLS